MSENNEAPPNRKLGFLAPLAIALVAVAVLLFATFSRKPPAPPAPPPPPAPAPVQTAPSFKPEPPLDRAALIAIGDRAAAAYAAGGPAAKSEIIGRSFILRLPFGCAGPQASPGIAQAAYAYDPTRKTIRVTVRPAVWTNLPQIQSLPNAGQLEAVQGFWLERPWSDAETCPPPRSGPPPAAPTPPSVETLGLASLFETGGSRVQRRGDRPYEVVRKVGEDDAALVSHSYRLVLEGRVSGFPGGQAARCWSETAAHRPVCLLGVTIDRVAIEDGQSGEVLGEWRD